MFSIRRVETEFEAKLQPADGSPAPLRYLLNCCRLIPISRQTRAIDPYSAHMLRKFLENSSVMPVKTFAIRRNFTATC